MKRLLCYDGMVHNIDNYEDMITLDLRKTELTVKELMNVYEQIEPQLIVELRKEILEINPDEIIVVGDSEEYRWLGTIICRIFGQFNSWNGQRKNPFGVTVLSLNGKPVKTYAIDTLTDIHLLELEKTH